MKFSVCRCCRGLKHGFIFSQSAVKDLPQTITAMVGDDVLLPCLLKPPKDASLMTVKWEKLDLRHTFVHVWHEGREHGHRNERASLSASKLKHGDASLKLSEVRFSDGGRYRCYFPKDRKEYFVELFVGETQNADTQDDTRTQIQRLGAKNPKMSNY
uniref:Ig-like domain-containing protein n=1 Tax=Nothobranchius furzeri TaxID=105023 RepID=A0A8C6M6Z9_NOTFU